VVAQATEIQMDEVPVPKASRPIANPAATSAGRNAAKVSQCQRRQSLYVRSAATTVPMIASPANPAAPAAARLTSAK
jgi:hypothetical protein